MRPDQAPALHNPEHGDPARIVGLTRDQRVVGVWRGTEARAYPINVLAYHRVVNDRIGGRQIAVGYSPLTDATLCVETDEPMRYSGKNYEADDLLMDARGQRLWSVLLGRELGGTRPMKAIPCATMTWSRFHELFPRARVVWPRHAPRWADYRRDPWAWYRRDPKHLVVSPHYVDLRLPQKQVVFGFVSGSVARAFPLHEGVQSAVNTIVNGREVLVWLEGGERFGAAYDRRLRDGRLLTFDRRIARRHNRIELIDRETRSAWNMLGRATRGPLAGTQLERLGGKTAYFLAWAAFYPGIQLFDDGEQRVARN
jgi:hypothetical protein